jgi:hypothetical protein
MKRSICLVSVAAFVIGVGATGCATLEPTRTALTIAKPPPPPPPPPPSASELSE